MDLELELVSDKAEKYGGHSLARVNVVSLSSQPVDHDKRLMNDPNERLCHEFSDEEEEFSSEGEAEGSDSEPGLEMHRRKSRTKMPGNARVSLLSFPFFFCSCVAGMSFGLVRAGLKISRGDNWFSRRVGARTLKKLPRG